LAFQRAFVEEIFRLRDSENEGIWIDELSIDQKNGEEKTVAIGSMDIIYRSSRQLVIILEDIEIPEEEEKIINKYWEEFQNDRGPDRPGWNQSTALAEDIRLMRKVFQKVLFARWFSRAWCSHEFRVSQYFLDDISTQPRFRAMEMAGNII
jgi:hypothetical protein